MRADTLRTLLRRAALVIAAAFVAAACSKEPAGLEIQQGSEVSVQSRDGQTVSGRLVDVQADAVVVETKDGQSTRIPRSDIRTVLALTPEEPPSNSEPAPAAQAQAPVPPEYREVELPAGTRLSVALDTTVGSATSQVEDQVRATVRRAVSVDGIEVIPAGAAVAGVVTQAERSGRVKGRARVAFRFTRLDLPGDAEPLSIRTAPIAREAEGTKKEDAAKIGAGAAAGAVIGGIAGGGDGAAKGAAIGGGAGTGVVLATRGKEVTLPAGTTVSATLAEPLVVRVRVR